MAWNVGGGGPAERGYADGYRQGFRADLERRGWFWFGGWEDLLDGSLPGFAYHYRTAFRQGFRHGYEDARMARAAEA